MVAFAFILAALLPASAMAAAGDLYAVTGAGDGSGNCNGTPSSLYTVDPATGAATLVGPITVNGTQVRHVTGLTVKPNDGTLYAIRGGQIGVPDGCTDFGESTLLTIDPATGAATVVGTAGSLQGPFPDTDFDPFGTLYGWTENTDDLATISLSGTSSSTVGDCDCSTFQTGLAIDSDGTIYVKSGSELWTVGHSTGQILSSISLDQSPHNMLAFDPSGTMYTGTRTQTGFTLQTIDPATGTVTDIGSNTVTNISSIAFDLGTFTPPALADLSLTKQVDDPTPELLTDVVFTLTVHNSGPAGATGIEVTDLLPSGYSYQSDDGAGAYNPTTGVWTVGSIASGNSAVLHITAQTTGGLQLQNRAEITAADQFDPDSDPGDDQGDDVASATTDPFNPGLDVAVSSINVKGSTRAGAKRKGFTATVTNDGTDTTTVSSGQFHASLNGNPALVTCRSFSTSLAPGESVAVRCAANIAGSGVQPGDSVTYSATIDVAFDEDPANDTETLTVTAS